MEISQLKNFIMDPSKVATINFMIWVDPAGFLSTQYLLELEKFKPIIVSNEYRNTGHNYINVIRSDEPLIGEYIDYNICICKSLGTVPVDMNTVVIFPDLEYWQIKDYVFTSCMEVDLTLIDSFIKACGNDIKRVDLELQKLRVLGKGEQADYIRYTINGGQLFDISHQTLENSLINAILLKNTNSLYDLLVNYDIKKYVDAKAFYHKIYTYYRQIALVLLNGNSVTTSAMSYEKAAGLYNLFRKVFTNDELISIMIMLSDLDYQLKTGRLSEDKLIKTVLKITMKGDN